MLLELLGLTQGAQDLRDAQQRGILKTGNFVTDYLIDRIGEGISVQS